MLTNICKFKLLSPSSAGESEDLVDGKIDETEELTLSDDGKVLTLKDKPVNSATVFTNVYDRH